MINREKSEPFFAGITCVGFLKHMMKKTRPFSTLGKTTKIEKERGSHNTLLIFPNAVLQSKQENLNGVIRSVLYGR